MLFLHVILLLSTTSTFLNPNPKHWIQRITFAAETNATDTHTQRDGVTASVTIPSPLAKRQRR